MNHIRQRNDIDCGIAASAMIASVSYAVALSCDPAPELERGYSLDDMIEALRRLGVCAKISRAGYGVPLRDRCPPGRALILIRRAGDRTGHWIAWDGERALDPERPRPLSIRAYDRADWLIVRTITGDAPVHDDCPRRGSLPALHGLGRPCQRRDRHDRVRHHVRLGR